MTRLSTVLFGVLMGLISLDANALSVLKSAEKSNEQEITFEFDKNINESNIDIKYFQDTIQISINGASVYPAKIFSVKDPIIKKVFAYQYTPKQIRCRLTIEGDAEAIQDRFKFKLQGNKLKASISEPAVAAVDKIKTSSAQINKSKNREEQLKKEIKLAENEIDGATVKEKKGGSPEVIASFGTLFLVSVFSIFGIIIAVAVRKVRLRPANRKVSQSESGKLSRWLTRMSGGRLAVKPKMISIESTHYLGPKKSIAIINVQGQRIVVGITNDSINLITRLDDEMENALDGEEKESDFSKNLFREIDNQDSRSTSAGSALKSGSSVRDEIRKKISELKPL